MNYDYNFGVGGDPNQIRFSDGRFSSLRLDERNLNEILPFTREQLEFLTTDPYNFDVQRVDNGSASVDWNRNGVHGERGISADINDGYALGVGRYNHVGHTHGNVAVASAGSHFVVVRSLIPRVNSRNYAGTGPSLNTPATLVTTTLRDREILNTGTLVRSAVVTGSPTALAVEGGMLIAAPSAFGTAQLGMFRVASDGRLEGRMRSISIGAHREIVLVGSASGAEVILWDPDSKQLSARSVALGSRLSLGDERAILGADSYPLTSAGPPGATFNSRTGQIILLTSENDGGNPDRLRLRPIRLTGTRFAAERGRWLADAPARSLDRPEIAFDGSDRAGGEGRYLVYFRQSEGESSQGYHQMHFVRVSLPRTTGSGPDDPYVFRRRMVINEWVRTRSAPAVAPYRDDFVLAWRVSDNIADETSRNQTEVNLFASGEFASGPADHDDITYIAQQGLRRLGTLRR